MINRRIMSWPYGFVWLAPLGLAALIMSGGCAAAGEDISDIGRRLFPPSPTQAAQWALDTEDPDRRREGLLLLSTSRFGGEPPYVRLYREYIANDPNPIVRAVAVRALARWGDAEDATLIVSHLDPEVEEDRTVRWEAARGLQRLHRPAVTRDLIEHLLDDSEAPTVRAEIARAMGQYRGDAVFQALVAVLDDPSLNVNRAARDALAGLTGANQGLEPADWLQWYVSQPDGTDVFAGAAEYQYPVYEREPSLFERLTFGSGRGFEEPGSPVGLKGEAAPDDEEAGSDS